MPKFAIALVLAVFFATQASASSGNAWSEFAAEVEEACLRAVQGSLTFGKAVVDPFGSEHYGLAIVSGHTPDSQTISMICVFNKQTKEVEIGSEMNLTNSITTDGTTQSKVTRTPVRR